MNCDSNVVTNILKLYQNKYTNLNPVFGKKSGATSTWTRVDNKSKMYRELNIKKREPMCMRSSMCCMLTALECVDANGSLIREERLSAER